MMRSPLPSVRTTISAAIFILLLSSCSSNTPPPVKSVAPIKMIQKPVIPTAPLDFTSAQQICDQLKTQFQLQLPAPIIALMHWQIVTTKDPAQINPMLVPACQMTLSTEGLIIEKLGLTPTFASAALERLDWTQDSAYAANSATGSQQGFIAPNYLAIVTSQFAPLSGACPVNQPIAACKVSKKKWHYQLTVSIFSR